MDWYAARIITGKLYVQQYLELESLTSYAASSVPNIIFIRCNQKRANKLTMELWGKLFFYRSVDGREPEPIDDNQMRNFMLVSSIPDQQLIVLDNADSLFAKGQRVRVKSGVFAGAEGIILRVKGDRRLVVSIDGVTAVATSYIRPEFLEKI